MSELFTVFSMQIYKQLLRLGFQPIGTRINPHDPTKVTWLYLRSPEFDTTVSSLIQKRRDEKPSPQSLA